MPAFSAPRHHSPAAGQRARLNIAVTTTGAHDLKTQAEQLARDLALPWVAGEQAGTDLLLVMTPERLELHDCRDPRLGPVYVDFTHLDVRRYSHNLSRRQPLARAVGKKTHTLVDATAGYCQDALLLALMGFRVTAIERSPVVIALAQDGLRRFTARSQVVLGQRLQLINGDARALLPSITPRPEAIYLDPMFPAKRKKSAAVKKQLRVLRGLVGNDPDALELLEISRQVAGDRVIVKRPDDAPPLAPDPSASISGKLVRYDIYLTHR
ncbi:MAG: class I SAM-dependent methyltransferase [Sulfuricaulis sp.]